MIHEFSYRLFRWKVPAEQIAVLVEPMRCWQLVANDYDLYQLGMRLKREFQLSFWDSLILAAAQREGGMSCGARSSTLVSSTAKYVR